MSSLRGLYYPFGIIQGESFDFSFEFVIDGIEQYFDEYTFVGQVKAADNIMVVANMAFTESEESSSIVDVTIPAANSQTVTPEEYMYEIRCTNKTTNKVKTLLYGTFTVAKTHIQTTGFGAFGGTA